MKTFTSPEHFTFTNHFNQSLLKSRIKMMNRTSTWRSSWRYASFVVAMGVILMCLQSYSPAQRTSLSPSEFGTRYLVAKKGKLYGVITPYATDKDIAAIHKALKKHGVTFELQGIERDAEGRISDIKNVILGDYGSETMKIIRRRDETSEGYKMAFFDFCYDPEVGCYPNIPPSDYPNVLSQVLTQEGLFTHNSALKQSLYDVSFKDKVRGVQTNPAETREKMERTWSGNMNQLLEASFFKRQGTMVYVRPDKYLDIYPKYQDNVTLFVDGKEMTLQELHKVHIRQVAKVYAHKRQAKEDFSGILNRLKGQTDYVVWIERAPNRLQRDSSHYIVSPFYTGEF